MDTLTLNMDRLFHLLTLFRVSKDELLERISVGLKNPLTEEDIFVDEIKISHLKKIDKIFNKGLSYYIDPTSPVKSREESIFFRKDHFNADLSLGAKQIVNKFEEEKIAFSTLAKLSDFKLSREIPFHKVSDSPKSVALNIRKVLYPEFTNNKRDFLKNLINKLAENNIIVFEFIEAHNKKEKANINGFFLAPNVIVLKRNQKALRREIFTLAHEIGHFLLNEEEIDDDINEIKVNTSEINHVEKWCNDFAFYFLAGDFANKISSLGKATKENLFFKKELENISANTHLSLHALYTRLFLTQKISFPLYKRITDEIQESIERYFREEKRKQELEKQRAIEEGRKIFALPPKPIISPLYLKTLQSALYTGLINDATFCKKLNIKPDKIEKYLL